MTVEIFQDNDGKWCRYCPSCRGIITITNPKRFAEYSHQKRLLCKHCKITGHPVSDITRKKISTSQIGKVISKKTRLLSSKSHMGISPVNKGVPMTEEQKYKCRIATINDLRKKGIAMGNAGAANYNPRACSFIDNLNGLLGLSFQHALNGGEIELYGYFVDGYDKDHNVIFEYDESSHNWAEEKRKDLIRQSNLLSKIKPSLFLRYNESEETLYDAETKATISI